MWKQPEIVATGLTFGEGPHWHQSRLWYSDFFTFTINSLGPTGDTRVEVQLDDRPCGVGWLPDGDLVVVSMTKRKVLRVDGARQVHVHADLSGIAPGPCNDMVVDSRGNAYVGNFGFDPATGPNERRPSDLYLIRPDGRIEVAATGLAFPNGSVVTPDGSTLIVGESHTSRYTAFTIAEDGTLSDRRAWAELDGGKAPDGCCLDAEGAIWMADAYGGGGCHRVGEGGRWLDFAQASQTVY
ncbi:MAG: gluconolactonase, partial [Acidimicrobiales bacterium]|nr:gluconolactonase [Acidimicrobiales bacterium]